MTAAKPLSSAGCCCAVRKRPANCVPLRTHASVRRFARTGIHAAATDEARAAAGQNSPAASRQEESRYAQLLSAGLEVAPPGPLPVSTGDGGDRVAKVEQEVTDLRNEIADLKRQLAEFRKQFE